MAAPVKDTQTSTPAQRAVARAIEQDLQPIYIAPGIYKVRSTSERRYHEIRVAGRHVVSCSCKGFEFTRECKHMGAVACRLVTHPEELAAAPASRPAPKRLAPRPEDLN